MNRKELLIGIIVGVIANAIGVVIAATTLGQLSGRSDGFMTVIEAAQSENFIGKLVSLGAILNLICFFYFLRKKKDHRAGGVLLATVLIAVFTLIIRL